MKVSLLFSFILLFIGPAIAQDTVSRRRMYHRIKSTDIIAGIHAQINDVDKKNYTFYEIGIAKSIYNDSRHGASGSSVYISEEIHFNKDQNIYGTKIGAWHHWMIDVGLSAIYYTDFKKGNFKIRPEFGVGMARLRAVVGYNIPTINNKAFKELQKNKLQLSAQVTFGIHKKIVQSHSY